MLLRLLIVVRPDTLPDLSPAVSAKTTLPKNAMVEPLFFGMVQPYGQPWLTYGSSIPKKPWLNHGIFGRVASTPNVVSCTLSKLVDSCHDRGSQ